MDSRSLSASLSCICSSNFILLLSKSTYASLDFSCAPSISFTILRVAFSACCTFVVLFIFFFTGTFSSPSDSCEGVAVWLVEVPGVVVRLVEGPGVAVRLVKGLGVAFEGPEGPGVDWTGRPGIALRLVDGPGLAIEGPEGPGEDWTGGPGEELRLVEGPGLADEGPEGTGEGLWLVEWPGLAVRGPEGPEVEWKVPERLGVAAALSKSCSSSLSQESTRWTGATDSLPPRTASIWL